MKTRRKPETLPGDKPRVPVIIGPTASGKTAYAIKLAEKIQSETGRDVEIISADSRQVYKHIPIAAAQPTKDELKQFRHHFINVLEPDEEFNAGKFGVLGRELISEIYNKGCIPIVAGGSGLYIKSLVYGLFDYSEEVSAGKQKEVRKQLYDELEKSGFEKLVKELKKVDPDTINNMPNITERRVIRALEVYRLTGIPISSHRKEKIEINFESAQFGLSMDRKILYEKINNRVDEMIKQGLIDEVKSLINKGLHYRTHYSLNTVGIKEVFDYLEGLITYERMLELIKQNTRRYAKRQMTWFRRDKNIKWIEQHDLNIADFKDFSDFTGFSNFKSLKDF